jgi:hypothetical protein
MGGMAPRGGNHEIMSQVRSLKWCRCVIALIYIDPKRSTSFGCLARFIHHWSFKAPGVGLQKQIQRANLLWVLSC